MSFLDAYETTTKIEIDAKRGYWIELWDHASEEALEEAERSMAAMKMVDGKPIANMDVIKYRHLVVLAHLKEWNLDDNGVVWPYTLKSIKRLPKAVFDHLWQVVDDLDTPLPQAERKRFRAASGGVDQDGNAGTA